MTINIVHSPVGPTFQSIIEGGDPVQTNEVGQQPYKPFAKDVRVAAVAEFGFEATAVFV
jgi:hypothetical protein